MLTYEQAKEIGKDACVDKLGRDFVMQYRDTSCPGCAELGFGVYCFVGVDNSDDRYNYDNPVLTHRPWPYIARCIVRYKTGRIKFLECVVPGDESKN